MVSGFAVRADAILTSMRIYTRTGDHGETGLFDGTRVPKEDARVASYGDVDELNSWLGVLRAETLEATIDAELARIQADLFEIGSDLATPGGDRSSAFVQQRIADQERWIDELMASLPKLKNFVLPAGSRAASLCHVARAVCRRAERSGWRLRRHTEFPDVILVYLNRLSDLLFALARKLNALAGTSDAEWSPRTPPR